VATADTPDGTRDSHREPQAYEALEQLITAAGFDAGDLQTALLAIQEAKNQKKKQVEAGENKFFLDKTLVYEDVDAFIFRRADSKSGRYYFRLYDENTKKPLVRSLRTSDKIQALASARLMYMDVKGKINRGERIRGITTNELIKIRIDNLKKIVTPIPHQGITPETFRVKQYYLSIWAEYIDSLDLTKRTIDKIQPETTREFGIWFLNKEKATGQAKGSRRSAEVVNNVITEVLSMYSKVAIRDRYISKDRLPQIDKVKEQKDGSYKNEVLTEEQYKVLWKYLEYQYTRDKKVRAYEIEMRKTFKDFIGILFNTGCRPKELLGLRVKDITTNHSWNTQQKEKNVVLYIPPENSKTGKGRRVVAPIKKRVDRILASYKRVGNPLQPNDYLFMNPAREDRNAFVRQNYFARLKRVLVKSGLQDELDRTGTSINLYSGRHTYACWRLRYGDVPIHLLAKQMGTSVIKIEQVYGHIETEQKLDVITKSQGTIKDAGIILETPEILDDPV
tara:strand:+ start:3286 stop:4803 length:1518 start_codon:yes stop_codon:yes gene_type:complete